MAVLVLSSFSSSLASSSIPLMVSGGGGLAVEGARVAAGLTSLAIALASPLSPCSSRCSARASRPARWLSLSPRRPPSRSLWSRRLPPAATLRVGGASWPPWAWRARCRSPRCCPASSPARARGSRSRWACCRPARSHCAWWAAARSRRPRSPPPSRCWAWCSAPSPRSRSRSSTCSCCTSSTS